MTEVKEKETSEYPPLGKFPVGDRAIEIYNEPPPSNRLVATMRVPAGVLMFETVITPEVMALYQFIYDYLHEKKKEVTKNE